MNKWKKGENRDRQRTKNISEDAGLERSNCHCRTEGNKTFSRKSTSETSPHLYLRIKDQGHVPVAMRIATLTCLPGPSPFLFLLAQLLLQLLIPGPELVEATSSCPSLCTCSNQASRVICTRQNLEEVPESISVNTRYLNLQENSIQVNICWMESLVICSSSSVWNCIVDLQKT